MIIINKKYFITLIINNLLLSRVFLWYKIYQKTPFIINLFYKSIPILFYIVTLFDVHISYVAAFRNMNINDTTLSLLTGLPNGDKNCIAVSL